MVRLHWIASYPIKGNDMGGNRKKTEPPGKEDGKSNKSPPASTEDDDREDGDFATPKRDRSDPDDEPL